MHKLGADFIVWSEFVGHTLPHYQKLEIGKLFEQYDRVLYVDTDILVREDTPDLFALVPDGELGVFDESPYDERERKFVHFLVSLGYDTSSWDRRYFNTGVMVLSKNHRNLFVPPKQEIDHYREQSYLNLMIPLTQTKVFPLPFRFNRVPPIAQTGYDRHDAYLLHYASCFVLRPRTSS